MRRTAFFFVLLLTGCGGSDKTKTPSPTASPTSSPSPRASDVTPSPTVVAKKGEGTETPTDKVDPGKIEPASDKVDPEKKAPTPIVVGGDLPADLPKDVPIFAGSKVGKSFRSGDSSALELSTSEKVDKVAAFYLRSFKDQGWKEIRKVDNDESLVLDGEKEGRTLTIFIAREGSETQILLTFGKKK